ncbi:alpha/beta hydrolase [Mesorhizobium sp. CAU 1741]|uniref:alpha/beta hydrolase n=1 Tax=Mesorhizobium sp. CAU 1741 TaxID=3140366 RepID=UPI00325B783E
MLAPFKDQLFAYPAVLGLDDGGRRVTVDYRSQRDINERDEVPERRVKRAYIDLAPRRSQQDLLVATEVARVPHIAVGTLQNARFIVIYLYGQGGNRKQGMNDYTFGGNFNRIKNLAYRNGGLYLTTDFSDFGDTGARQVASLISFYATSSPRAPIYVACGSMGGGICWRLADDPDVAPRLGGLMLLGSHWDEGFLSSRAFAGRVPVFFGHGSDDTVFPVAQQERFFRSILAKAPDYPVRFVRFETGSHGTPIRMTDWRDTLNWMNSVR